MSVMSGLRRLLGRRSKTFSGWPEVAERSLILQAHSHALVNRGRRELHSLRDAELSAFSQWGEDGIIDWLIERLPGIAPTFVEFGVGDYRESNTRLLLQTRNWRGAVIDGSVDHIADIRRQDIYWRHDLNAQCAFIDRDNINALIVNAGLTGDIGLLSIDVDGNDYWIWEAVTVVQPAIVICEYNAVFGDIAAVSVPYASDFVRSIAHFSHLYFGASLRAFVHLAAVKGYRFVGTVSSGCNAFFVRDDLAQTVLDALERIAAYPSSVREARDETGNLSFTGGLARARLVEHLPLIDVTHGHRITLADLPDIYSDDWSSGRWTEL